ncbi:hypothetical protein [Cryptosporangium aurantiacum]|uniref:Uncharacterized protein n=1 Tax=Cryptosporangium aurantiacum TaxID=134849 RepID=A0A1M7TYZ3_9ACTN|nr:hypothetical protein [Cryptosporangium aurantiacum]SHN75905.1 hypothetical protein SAMN05443668_107411 [Cryptosporangium aurantiacum]
MSQPSALTGPLSPPSPLSPLSPLSPRSPLPVASIDTVADALARLEHAAAALRCRPTSAEHSYPATLCRRLVDVRSRFDDPGERGRADARSVAAALLLATEIEHYLTT